MSSREDNINVWARLMTAEHALRQAVRYADGQMQVDLKAALLIVSAKITDLLREDAALAGAARSLADE